MIIIILDTGQTKFHLCVCNVGDSLAYVYSDGQVITVILILTLLETCQNYSHGKILSARCVRRPWEATTSRPTGT